MSDMQVFTTGGTIDKIYNEISGELVFPEQTQVPRMLEEGRFKVFAEVGQLMMVDSLDMTEEQRAEIVAACRETEHDRIVITHGTDTMPETARAIDEVNADKTVVLLGAMRPYSMGGSDALFNLGSAVTASQILPAGVYVTMNGRVLSAETVVKNKQAGVFEAVTGEEDVITAADFEYRYTPSYLHTSKGGAAVSFAALRRFVGANPEIPLRITTDEASGLEVVTGNIRDAVKWIEATGGLARAGFIRTLKDIAKHKAE